MPKRLDRVLIPLATRSEPFALTWDSRQELLGRASRQVGMESVVEAFETAGASKPVKLTADDKASLFEFLEAWAKDEDSISDLPAGIWDLRTALADELGVGGAREQ